MSKPTMPSPPKKARKVTTPMLEANRANAQRSTGPRTEEGKAASSRNAWKHGLNSQASRMALGNGAASMAKLFGKPCLTTCAVHPDNPERTDHPCGLVLDGLTRAGGNCLDKTVYVHAAAGILDMMEGAAEGMNHILAAEGASMFQLIHELRSQITTQGLSIPQYAINKQGEVVLDPATGEPLVLDYKMHPGWGVLLGIFDKMGISLPEMLATPASRSRAKVNDQTADAMTTVLGRIMSMAGGPAQRAAIPHRGGDAT